MQTGGGTWINGGGAYSGPKTSNQYRERKPRQPKLDKQPKQEYSPPPLHMTVRLGQAEIHFTDHPSIREVLWQVEWEIVRRAMRLANFAKKGSIGWGGRARRRDVLDNQDRAGIKGCEINKVDSWDEDPSQPLSCCATETRESRNVRRVGYRAG